MLVEEPEMSIAMNDLTYGVILKLSKIKIGLLINFNTVDLKQGIHRLAM
jgi:hypothetical protein